MNQKELVEIINLLKKSLQTKDWDYVLEARDFITEYIELDSEDEDEAGY